MNYNDLYQHLDALGINGLVLRNNNLMGCCPSHDETNPSWGISVEPPHLHACFSCGFKGNLFSLLVFLGMKRVEASKLAQLDEGEFKLRDIFAKEVEPPELFDVTETYHLYPTIETYQYLCGIRKLPVSVVRRAKCMFDRQSMRVLFPWYFDGKMVGLTGRTVIDDKYKTLPYYGTKKGQWFYLPYGKIAASDLILVEGEVDALKCCAAGFTNVAALGFGKFTKTQLELLLKSPAKSTVLCFDHDKRGKELVAEVSEAIGEKHLVRCVDYSPYALADKKLDPGDMPTPDLRRMLTAAIKKHEWLTL